MTAEEYREQGRIAREKAAKVWADARQTWLAIAEQYELLARIAETEERKP
jgi:hypothetical protein